MIFESLSNSKKNILKTFGFYVAYVLLALLSFYTLPGGICAPGPNAILILLAPFVVGIFTLINLIKVFNDKIHLGSLIIHFVVFFALLILINT